MVAELQSSVIILSEVNYHGALPALPAKGKKQTINSAKGKTIEKIKKCLSARLFLQV